MRFETCVASLPFVRSKNIAQLWGFCVTMGFLRNYGFFAQLWGFCATMAPFEQHWALTLPSQRDSPMSASERVNNFETVFGKDY